MNTHPLLCAVAFAASLAGASTAQAANGWQMVASGCTPAPASAKLLTVSTKTGAVSFKDGKTGTAALICPINYEFTGTNVLDQLEVQALDATANGSVRATLVRKSKTTGSIETLANVVSVDATGVQNTLIGFTPASINFFTHAAYVVLQLSRTDPAADVQAHMVHLSRFIP
ncbi:hypothetical protein KAK06_23805 [Ideonella sp. 4Y11]|uniref:Uncharacterized protein n=1 Tax=Ideonella aquatica TaxID=2824119 RepID=A0A940YQ50_9BURK|nr:hypothetical protein [Ideonella aquatica]MBQ0961984.1 hypothetical protein [Ideonella aquatica]